MGTLPRWLEYIESQIGFILPSNQHHWLENAIFQTASKHKTGIDQLWKQVRNNPKLRQELLDAVLILESRFFRHPPSIDFITKLATQQSRDYQLIPSRISDRVELISDDTESDSTKVLSSIEEKNHKPKPQYSDEFRVWSVGCSEGQEVWTIAMSLTEAEVPKFHIVGSDVSTKALNTAKQAIYEEGSQLDIPLKCQKFINPLALDNSRPIVSKELLKKENTGKKRQVKQYWHVDTTLHKQVSFVMSNAFVDDSDNIPTARLLTKQDVIVCQNMLIYFRQFDQRDILARMVGRCSIGGHIILAPGEAVFWKHPQMQRVDNDKINAWQKVK